MLFEPLLGTALSGKIGGIVASHNKGGAYFRAFVIPTNPNTPQQVAVRNAVAQLTSLWADILTIAQQKAWQLYADNVTLTNRIGNQINVSGLAMYVRSNVAKMAQGLFRQDSAPTIFDLGAHSLVQIDNATAAGQTVDFKFSTSVQSDPWANEANSFLLVYLSRPQNPGITYFTGPYRFAGSVQGDAIPPTSPLTVAVPFVITEGQRVFGRAVVTYTDGRYTTDSLSTAPVVA